MGGGGARSGLWLKIHADVLGEPIYLTRETESTALGAALAAAVGSGLYRSFDEAASAMVQLDKVIEPNPSHHAVYDYHYDHYRRTYAALRPLMHELSERK